MRINISLTTFLSTVQATSLLVPLYLDPSQGVQDGSMAAWNPILTAVANSPNTQFQIILNPNNGPGNSKAGYDSEYITSVAKLNAYPNVHTFGYVHTSYGARSSASVQTDIARWANWNTYTKANIAIKGIFFDEVPNSSKKGNTDVAYMSALQTYAKSQFGNITTFQTFYNVGDLCAHTEYFNNMADYVCIFEDEASKFSTAVLGSRLPAGKAAKSCVLLIDYMSSGFPSANVSSMLQYFVSLGIGSANILDYDYDQANAVGAPADVGSVARILSSS
ncbi:hypothetical protein N0V93_004157 [Gnomoniopsis smithogilvyi]|uniref:Spherulin-4 n=1 Tax=Gnomoniopsis smithogilvyi TaxID=1191159 RepID=A0A9W9CWX8_9PEZI|nr:hypothetical protein N0V93_004157 [Gnomoniopsis smithogilvyi]